MKLDRFWNMGAPISLQGFIADGFHDCCITASCYTLPWPSYSNVTMPCVKGRKTERFLNVAACVNRENHLLRLKVRHRNIPGTMRERALQLEDEFQRSPKSRLLYLNWSFRVSLEYTNLLVIYWRFDSTGAMNVHAGGVVRHSGCRCLPNGGVFFFLPIPAKLITDERVHSYLFFPPFLC